MSLPSLHAAGLRRLTAALALAAALGAGLVEEAQE